MEDLISQVRPSVSEFLRLLAPGKNKPELAPLAANSHDSRFDRVQGRCTSALMAHMRTAEDHCDWSPRRHRTQRHGHFYRNSSCRGDSLCDERRRDRFRSCWCFRQPRILQCLRVTRGRWSTGSPCGKRLRN